MRKAVCFDVGGTLVGSTHPGLCRRVAAVTEYSVDELRPFFKRHLLTSETDFPSAIEAFCRDLSISSSTLQTELTLLGEEEFFIYDDVVDVLEEIYARHQVATLSNATPWEGIDLENSAIGEFLDATVYSYEIGVAKPHPAAFDAVERRLEVESSKVVMVGDSAIDVTGAKDAGWAAVYVQRGTDDQHKLADTNVDYLIPSLSELPGVIEGQL